MTYNHLEETIMKLYTKIGIKEPSDLAAEIISERMGFSVFYIQGISKYIASQKTFYLTDHFSPQEKWQSFGHELCHALWHSGSQLNMPIDWRLYQEWKANRFAYEACVPRYLLEKELIRNPTTHPIYLIAEKFGVTKEFAVNRYIIHTRRMSPKQEELFQAPYLY